MKSRVQKILVALVIFTVATLVLGRVFDSRCATGCINEAFAANSAHGMKELEKLNIHLNFSDKSSQDDADKDDGKDDEDSDSMTINLGDKDDDMGGDESNPLRKKEPLTEHFAAKGLKEIIVKSYVSQWTIGEATGDEGALIFKGYLPSKEWTLVPSTSKLSIETTKKGPNEAELLLPKNFEGKLSLITVSGAVTVQKLAKTADLEIVNVTGVVIVNASPSQKLNINTVSGDVAFGAVLLSKDLNFGYHSVSSNLEATINSPIHSFTAETVSGNVELTTKKSVGFHFVMEGISASFDGLPKDTSKEDGFAHRGAKGSFGPDPKGELKFNSVSGDFHLKHAE